MTANSADRERPPIRSSTSASAKSACSASRSGCAKGSTPMRGRKGGDPAGGEARRSLRGGAAGAWLRRRRGRAIAPCGLEELGADGHAKFLGQPLRDSLEALLRRGVAADNPLGAYRRGDETFLQGIAPQVGVGQGDDLRPPRLRLKPGEGIPRRLAPTPPRRRSAPVPASPGTALGFSRTPRACLGEPRRGRHERLGVIAAQSSPILSTSLSSIPALTAIRSRPISSRSPPRSRRVCF